ncbi:galactose-3-O-sulfotransferase 2-like [Ylistrum balloti]|uniref:galactose-3-O-sulfotransferase 2-like n=1 Tax=Ylistrum balloti TaxID=509963 RepID=UPI00290587EA|nr:galactose-3-O-sulfotransferase 2-like [Ylistrum balloti]
MSSARLWYLVCVAICTSVFLFLALSMEGSIKQQQVLDNSSSGSSFRSYPLNFSGESRDSTHSTTAIDKEYLHQYNPHRKKTNAVFLKVHKAGSTTVMNIFLRFGMANKLNIVLPNKEDGYGFNYLGHGKTVDKNTVVPIPHNETYNILCNHVVYNRQAFRDIMPNDTVYVGIIREPQSHFLSASFYYRFIDSIQKVSGLSNRSAPAEAIHQYFSHQDRYHHIRTLFVRNRMSYDFGLPPSRFHDNVSVENFIADVAGDFKLVMVMEYFAESLVLLKRYLGWGLDDILYVPLNINNSKSKKHVSLLPADVTKLKQWNYADFRLYDFFKTRFLAQVEAEGVLFHKEVKHFKTVQLHVQNFCSDLRDRRYLTIHASPWNEKFNITPDHCKIMTMSEIPLVKMLIRRAKHKYQKYEDVTPKDII